MINDEFDGEKRMMVMIVIGFMIEALTMVILEMELNKGG
jgi:hypothetical protein